MRKRKKEKAQEVVKFATNNDNNSNNRRSALTTSYLQGSLGTDVKYRFYERVKALLSQETYAQKCVDKIVGHSVGKGFVKNNEAINDIPKKFFNIALLKAIVQNYVSFGNAYLEIEVVGGVVAGIWLVPVKNLFAYIPNGNRESDYSFKQVSYVTGKTVYFDNWCNARKSDGSLESGSYILQLKNYDDENPYFGKPTWISCERKIEILSYADEYNVNYFKEGQVSGVATVNGQGAIQALKQVAKVTSNVENRRQNVALLATEQPAGADNKQLTVDFTAFGKEVITDAFLKTQQANEVTVCAAFQVPPKLVGMETPGKLGGSGDLEMQINGYCEDTIKPLQSEMMEIIKSLFPDNTLELEPCNISVTPVTEEVIITEEAK